MAFDETRLSEEVERGASGGRGFKTRIAELESGYEKRNQDWAQARGDWDVGYGLQDLDEASAVQTLREIDIFHKARRGKVRGFRFKDWFDFEIGDPNNPTVTFQQIGVGDNAQATFQTFKRYDDGINPYDHTIKKLVSGTVTILIDGVVDGTAAVNLNTGIITPTLVPGVGELVQIACEYDVPVRFDIDLLVVQMQLFNAGSMPNIPIRELRLR